MAIPIPNALPRFSQGRPFVLSKVQIRTPPQAPLCWPSQKGANANKRIRYNESICRGAKIAAAAAVLATFCMSTMIPLRIVAFGINIPFMAYGYVDHLYPLFMPHAILLSVNALRLVKFSAIVARCARCARCAYKIFVIQSLLPYMTQNKFYRR
jgi:hypothetical protein